MQGDATIKPWLTEDFTGTEYHVYDSKETLLGTWYGSPGNLRWAQWCDRCGSYFTRMIHACPQITSPHYAGTPAIPPTHAPPARDPLQDKPGRMNAWVYKAILPCGHQQTLPLGKPPVQCKECQK